MKNKRIKKGKTHNKIYRKQHTNNTINHEQQQKNCHLKQSVKYICDTFVNVYNIYIYLYIYIMLISEC